MQAMLLSRTPSCLSQHSRRSMTRQWRTIEPPMVVFICCPSWFLFVRESFWPLLILVFSSLLAGRREQSLDVQSDGVSPVDRCRAFLDEEPTSTSPACETSRDHRSFVVSFELGGFTAWLSSSSSFESPHSCSFASSSHLSPGWSSPSFCSNSHRKSVGSPPK